MHMYTERFYRNWTQSGGLATFRVVAGESDLQIYAEKDLRRVALSCLVGLRERLCSHIALNPLFLRSLTPVRSSSSDPLVRRMEDAGAKWNTGPMAAVAGAIAQAVGEELLSHSGTVIVENGGDVWARSPEPLDLLVYPGEASPLSSGIPFSVDASQGVSVCTSSGKVGPSFSLGRADSVTAIHPDGAQADAAATALANRIRGARDLTGVVESVAAIRELHGILAVCGESIGIWGGIRLRKEA